MPHNKGKKMGMVQLGLLTVAALLLSGALIVKGKRDATSDVAISMAQESPAAGDENMPQRTFGNNAIPPHQSPSDPVEGVPGAIEGSAGATDGEEAGISVEEAERMAPPEMMPADACAAYQSWVGQPVDRAAVEATGKPHRILKPGDMMTMDFNPERINVETDEKGEIVQRVFCG